MAYLQVNNTFFYFYIKLNQLLVNNITNANAFKKYKQLYYFLHLSLQASAIFFASIIFSLYYCNEIIFKNKPKPSIAYIIIYLINFMSEKVVSIKLDLFDSLKNTLAQTTHKYKSISPSKSIEVGKKRLKFFNKNKNQSHQLKLNFTQFDQNNFKIQHNFDDHQNFIAQKTANNSQTNKSNIKMQYTNQKKIIVKKIRSSQFIFKDEIKSHLSNNQIKTPTFQQKVMRINNKNVSRINQNYKNYNILKLIQEHKKSSQNKTNQKQQEQMQDNNNKQTIFDLYPKTGPFNLKNLKRKKGNESPILTIKNHVFEVYFSKNMSNTNQKLINFHQNKADTCNITSHTNINRLNKTASPHHGRSKSFYEVQLLQNSNNQIPNLSLVQMKKTQIMNKIMSPCQITAVQFSKRASSTTGTKNNKYLKTRRIIKNQFNIQQYDLNNANTDMQFSNRKSKCSINCNRKYERQIHTSYTARNMSRKVQLNQEKLLIDAWDSHENIVDDL